MKNLTSNLNSKTFKIVLIFLISQLLGQSKTFCQTSIPSPSPSPLVAKKGVRKAVRFDPRWAKWNGLWTSNYENGKVEEKGINDHGTRIGVWNFWYPNGNKLGEFTFGSGSKILNIVLWHENGNKYFEGVRKPDIKARIGEVPLKFFVWDPNGRLVAKGNYDDFSGNADFTSFWPSGKDGMRCSVGSNACGNKTISVLSEKNDPYFMCSTEEEGWGNSDTCVQRMTINQKPYVEVQKCDFNGSVTLLYPSWIKEFDVNEILDKVGELTPCLIQEYKEGKRNGPMIVYEPFKDNKILSGNFIDDLADGSFVVGFENLYATAAFQRGIAKKNWDGEGLLPYKINKDSFDFVFDPGPGNDR